MPRNTLLDTTRDAFGGRNGADPVRTWTTLAGATLVLVGGYLPWLRYNPEFEGVGLVLTTQVNPGFEGFDLLLVVPVGLVVAVLAVRGQSKWWSRATALVGLAAVLLPALHALDSFTETNPYYVPDVGLVVTFLGGLFLLVAGGYDRFVGD